MNIIFDTNIVVSAILKDRTPELVIRFVVGTPPWTWIASRDILNEYQNVLRRPKFKLPDDIIAMWDDLFEEHVKIVPVSNDVYQIRDPKDELFLQCLAANETAYFVTGDRDFSSAPQELQPRIYTLSDFKSHIDLWQPDI